MILTWKQVKLKDKEILAEINILEKGDQILLREIYFQWKNLMIK